MIQNNNSCSPIWFVKEWEISLCVCNYSTARVGGVRTPLPKTMAPGLELTSLITAESSGAFTS